MKKKQKGKVADDEDQLKEHRVEKNKLKKKKGHQKVENEGISEYACETEKPKCADAGVTKVR